MTGAVSVSSTASADSPVPLSPVTSPLVSRTGRERQRFAGEADAPDVASDRVCQVFDFSLLKFKEKDELMEYRKKKGQGTPGKGAGSPKGKAKKAKTKSITALIMDLLSSSSEEERSFDSEDFGRDQSRDT